MSEQKITEVNLGTESEPDIIRIPKCDITNPTEMLAARQRSLDRIRAIAERDKDVKSSSAELTIIETTAKEYNSVREQDFGELKGYIDELLLANEELLAEVKKLSDELNSIRNQEKMKAKAEELDKEKRVEVKENDFDLHCEEMLVRFGMDRKILDEHGKFREYDSVRDGLIGWFEKDGKITAYWTTSETVRKI